ncbi:zinc-dependent alcohol dehydrogenase family protein [Burkholderia pseudomultivorans]|uniref:zinc-dependent alcohol dehydrogenase family protein n=1 Tax=Burkholderia pseudomultivorans TaxID=1207504 RepID=UPI00188DF94A|nr:zinc-dependent alcohol dehydrogenase family protein [Burkholderia pseudomultivorans]MBF5010868.1 zinc-dependent alcohol dehydrogenase family protein [Burkholderia pseudomultivorans]
MSKVIRFHRVGGPEVLQIEDVDVPAPKAGEVQIKVKALGINRAEVMYRAGQYVIEPSFPARLGYEAAGEVVAVGSDVTEFSAGDRVGVIPAFSFADYGMYGELVNAPASAVVKTPEGVSFDEAAATWMAFTTAYGALISLGRLKAGETVVIGAATSSVGMAAIQIAKAVKATPIALTRSLEKKKALLDGGAAHVFVNDDARLRQQLLDVTGNKGVNMVFDPVGGPNARSLIQALGHGGTFFQYGALDARDIPVPVMDILAKHLTVRGYELFEITTDPQRLAEAKSFITQGLSTATLRPTIDRRFSFDEIAEAHRYMEAGNQIGKIVVTI